MVLGLGYGLFSSPNTNAIMSSVEMKHLGIASGMVATMRSLGQLLSMAIAMFCFAIFIGTAPNHSRGLPGTHDQHHGGVCGVYGFVHYRDRDIVRAGDDPYRVKPDIV